MFTTLNKIREQSSCPNGWIKLLRHLGKRGPDDEQLSFATILESNGLEHAMWCLLTLDDQKAVVRFALGCARMVEHLMLDERSRYALRTVEAWLDAAASDEEVCRASAAADAAALAAWGVRASLVARGVLAAGDAGEVCAEDAAADAANAAADAANAAAWAAWAAADAADAAGRAARAAGRAAREAARAEILELQRTLFLDIFGKD